MSLNTRAPKHSKQYRASYCVVPVLVAKVEDVYALSVVIGLWNQASNAMIKISLARMVVVILAQKNKVTGVLNKEVLVVLLNQDFFVGRIKNLMSLFSWMIPPILPLIKKSETILRLQVSSYMIQLVLF